MRSSMKARPLPGLYYIDAECEEETQETKQSSKFQSDPSSNNFTIDVWNKIKILIQHLIFLLSCYLYHFTQVM